jgi:AraC-like DNA-binding protein
MGGSATNPPAYLRFSSGAVPGRDRIAVVREVFGRRMMRLEIKPLPGVPFWADLTLRMMPRLGVVMATSSPMNAARTRNLLTDGDDALVVQISSAAARGTLWKRDFTIEPGDAVMVSNAEAGEIVFPSPSTVLALRLERSLLAPLLADGSTPVRIVPRDTEALKLLVAYIGTFNEVSGPASVELQHAVAVHVYDLLALAIGATRDARAEAEGRGLRAARLRAIKADVAAHSGETGLRTAEVARRHGISESYVRKLFEGEGTSFSRYVRDLRLEHAHRLLTDPRLAGRSITWVALEAGFGDLSHFNRRFRRRFGDTPSAVRAGARRDEGP